MGNNPPEKAFYPSLAALRGAAALVVVAYHTVQPLGFRSVNLECGFMAVDFFFLLSGVVIEARYGAALQAGLSTLGFSWMRLVRIYPLYIAGSAITLAMLLATGTALPHHAWLGLALLPELNGPLFPLDTPAWSLLFELLVNILYAALFPWLRGRFLLLVIATSWVGIVLYPHGLIALMTGGLLRASFSFLLGVALYRWHQSRPRLPWRGRFWPAALIGLLLLALCASPPGLGVVPWFLACITCIFPLLIVAALRIPFSPLQARAANLLGLLSYPLYALHVPMLVAMQGLMRHIHWPEGAVPQAVLFYATLLLASMLLERFYDRPVRAWLSRGRKAGKPSPATALGTPARRGP